MGTDPQAATGMDTNRKIQIGLAGTIVVVAIGMFIWKGIAVSTVEAQMAQARTQSAEARTQLIEQARLLDERKTMEGLKRFSAPLAWALRREVMANNMDQIDQYFTDLVQIQGFQTAVLSNPEGKIMVASDRKQLASDFASLYPESYLQAGEIKIERSNNGNLRAVIPVMGLSQHLATAVVEYTPAAFALP